MKHLTKLAVIFLFCFIWSCSQNNKLEHTKYLEEISIYELSNKYKSGELTITQVVQDYLTRIEILDKGENALNSIIVVNPDAIKIAKQLQEELESGRVRGPLHGIPVILKDNIESKDSMATTAGSRALANSIMFRDSKVAQKLRDAGAIIIAKANLSEWANFRGDISSSGWSGVGGQTNNPYVLDRNPCGSSSGSGVAVSANLATIAIGTETNGSIVCPSSLNGVVGLKPTVGLISRTGIIPISFTQDTPGPMTRSVSDAAIVLGALCGVDSLDSKTLVNDAKFYSDYTPFLKSDGLKGKRIGLVNGLRGAHYRVDTLLDRAIELIESAGATVIKVDLPLSPESRSASYQIMLYEFKDGLLNYFNSLGESSKIKTLDDLIKFNLEDSVEMRFYNQSIVEAANAKGPLTEVEYLKALEIIKKEVTTTGIDKILKEYKLDAFVAPTGTPAWKTDHTNGDNYLLSSSSYAAIAGYPNITVPMGFIDNLPVGISFFSKAWSEPTLIEIAYAYEQLSKHRRAPSFIVSQ